MGVGGGTAGTVCWRSVLSFLWQLLAKFWAGRWQTVSDLLCLVALLMLILRLTLLISPPLSHTLQLTVQWAPHNLKTLDSPRNEAQPMRRSRCPATHFIWPSILQVSEFPNWPLRNPGNLGRKTEQCAIEALSSGPPDEPQTEDNRQKIDCVVPHMKYIRYHYEGTPLMMLAGKCSKRMPPNRLGNAIKNSSPHIMQKHFLVSSDSCQRELTLIERFSNIHNYIWVSQSICRPAKGCE